MKYLISINSNFPNREYGKFSCREGELEYLLFREVEPIDLTIRLDFINFEAVAEKWDCIPTNKVHIYLLNPKAMALFEEYYTGKFELVLCQEIVQNKKRKFYYPARTSFSLDELDRYNFSNSLGDKYPQ